MLQNKIKAQISGTNHTFLGLLWRSRAQQRMTLLWNASYRGRSWAGLTWLSMSYMEEGLAFKIRQNIVYKNMEMQTNLAYSWFRNMVFCSSSCSAFYLDLEMNLIEKDEDMLWRILITIQKCLEWIGTLRILNRQWHEEVASWTDGSRLVYY